MNVPRWFAQAERPIFEPVWIVDNTDRILEATVEHLLLTGAGVVIGLIVSLGLSVIALGYRRAFDPILAVSGILYTIPSLAAFALAVPFFGFSWTSAIIPLVTYTLLILVKNIVVGIDGVAEDVVESARAMGYRPPRLFLTVQLPLALPVIIAGIRIATVTVIGLVTVTAVIGLGGLGGLILQGLRTLPPYPTQMIVGTVFSVVLAIGLDLLLLGAERLLTPWSRRQGTT